MLPSSWEKADIESRFCPRCSRVLGIGESDSSGSSHLTGGPCLHGSISIGKAKEVRGTHNEYAGILKSLPSVGNALSSQTEVRGWKWYKRYWGSFY